MIYQDKLVKIFDAIKELTPEDMLNIQQLYISQIENESCGSIHDRIKKIGRYNKATYGLLVAFKNHING